LVLLVLLLGLLALLAPVNSTHVSVDVEVDSSAPAELAVEEESEPVTILPAETEEIVGASAASHATFDVPNPQIESSNAANCRDEEDDAAVNDPDSVPDEEAYTELTGTTQVDATKKPTHKKAPHKLPPRKPAPKKSHTPKKPRTCHSTAVAKAQSWANAKLQYCQSAYMQRDFDPSCSSICRRQSNRAWNAYRSDCSGLVSYSWGIRAPGLITTNFAPFDTSVTYSIKASALTPGDAVNNAEHVMLFKRWISHGSVAEFIEEPGCSSSVPHAKVTRSSVSISGSRIFVTAHGTSFTAIRRRGCN